MPTIYETRTKTGKPHKTKLRRAELLTRAYRVKEAAERDGLQANEVREAVKRHLYGLALGSNSFYNVLNCVMAMKEPIETDRPLGGMGRVGTLTP